VFALAAAFCNALNMVTQHIASIGDPGHSKGWRFVRYLVSSPLWLFGWVALAGGFVFQALALHNGLLSVVQPLLVTELVFALVLRRVWIHQSIRAVTWWAGAVTCVSLALFVAVSEPSGGHATPTSSAWLGATASILWALVATFIKATTDSLTQFGVGGMFLHWPVYALAVTGLAAELLNQAALHVGPLSMSQPFMVVIDPIVSIVLSVWIFDEAFTENTPRLVVGSLSFAVMCLSVMVLARTAPATMEPAARTDAVTPPAAA